MSKKLLAWGYGLLLAAFTVYVLLDTFVITRVYSVVPEDAAQSSAATSFELEASVLTSSSSQQEEPSKPGRGTDRSGRGGRGNRDKGGDSSNAASSMAPDSSSDLSYDDGNISISITEYREQDTAIYVADVRLSSPEYLKTALAQDSYGRNVTEKTSEIAERNGAILAVNGDYYGAQERGYVLKNGVLYRETVSRDQEDLVIWQDGSFAIINESEVSADELLSDGAAQVLSFGPALVVDGQIAITPDEEVGKAKTSNPRTAIGIVDELHYLFVVSDGRTDASEGLTLYQLAEFMQGLGADIAYNLDGGGSSTMVFQGEVINNPTTNGKSIKERSVSDIVCIGN